MLPSNEPSSDTFSWWTKTAMPGEYLHANGVRIGYDEELALRTTKWTTYPSPEFRMPTD